MTDQAEKREEFFHQMKRKVFLDMVSCSATEQMQVSHVRDLAEGACDVFQEQFEFYGWVMPERFAKESKQS